jgi:hypothetical protein
MVAEPQITRRQIVGFLVASAVGCSRLPEKVADPNTGNPRCSAIAELNLPSSALAQVEHMAPGVLAEARWLEDLPLDDLPPAFVFIPRL